MKKLMFVVAILVIIVTGCKLDMISEVYVTDLIEVVTGEARLTTPATISFEIPSAEECNKYSSQVMTVMRGMMREFTPKECKNVDMNSYLIAEAKMPFVHDATTWSQSDSLFGILVTTSELNLSMTLRMNTQKYNTVNQRMKDEFHQGLNLTDSKITLVLVNDEREPIEYHAQAAFINNQPIVKSESFRLERRQKATIRLSNVSAAYLAMHGSVPFLTLRMNSPIQISKQRSERLREVQTTEITKQDSEEVRDWNRIKHMRRGGIAHFRHFLENYPNGEFSSEARQRIQELLEEQNE